MRRLVFSSSRLLVFLCAGAAALGAQGPTSPRQFFGHDIGADYVLPNYTKFLEYFQRLARESDRMELDTIGLSEEGRPQVMAIVSSPANLANKERYRRISEQLSRAEGLTDAQARQLAKEGKTIVWIDGGLHATEVLGAQQLIETTWQLVSATDEETMRFLNDCIILLAHANPDGMQLVSDWYMRNPDTLARSTGGLPRLYEKYAGHDNNRDSYMNNTSEARNVSRVMYTEWYPQIMYNHHQTGPQGAVMFAPPFRDPMNFNLHPLMKTGLDFVGAAIHQRMVQEKKGGSTMRTGSNYSTWWNGGLRTTAYFHNQIGILTETIGNPTPTTVPFIPGWQIPSADLPLPVKPGVWKFRQSIDYSVTANKAILDLASRMGETWRYNIYAMGRDAIAQGNADSWTMWPRKIIAACQSLGVGGRGCGAAGGGRGGAGGGRGGGGGGRAGPEQMAQLLQTPATRDPRGYILSADQRDFGTAAKFMRVLQYTGIDVQRATAPFTVSGKQYPAGSFVVKTAQAFRPMVLDMFEPQDHPDDFAYPGANPTAPYDVAGWTVALQMGVQFDRVLEAFDGPFVKLRYDDFATPVARTVTAGGAAYLIDPAQNDAVVLANRLYKANVPVFRTNGAGTVSQGTWVVARGGAADAIVSDAARTLGLRVATGARPTNVSQVRAPRVGLFDRFGGMMPEGWTRYMLERFEVPFTRVYPQMLDAGNLNAQYDVLVFVSGAITGGGGGRGGGRGGDAPPADSAGGGGGRGGRGAGAGGGGRGAAVPLPPELQAQQGSITTERTIPQIKAFIEGGGRVVTIGGSTSLARILGLPVDDHLVENGVALPNSKIYIPGSVLEVAVDTTLAIASGMNARANVFFDDSPVFKLGADAAARGVKPIAWFESATPLKSGWAWGQNYLKDGVAAAQANVGQGTLYLFGPEILFRAQPHGTFKFLFNAIYGVK
ncbi:MAG TPA: M14 metallopeptidase family protein [Gemmatimonadaceae bacterium]|nr:M14 metallopeptidase family protein [Gemmatimonadaceae bacterium]